jgi:predicted transcriptional regulator of viral defense system
MNGRKQKELAMQLLSDGQLWSAKELSDKGVHHGTLRRMFNAGEISSDSRGFYQLPEFSFGSWHSLSLVAARSPQALICFYTAANFHDLSIDMPTDVYVAVPWPSTMATDKDPPVRLSRWRNADAFTVGVEVHDINGQSVAITSPARTLVDLFRFSPLCGKRVGNGSGVLVDEESVLVAFGKYVNKGGSMAEVARIAATFGVEKEMSPLVKTVSMMAAQMDMENEGLPYRR